MMERGPVKRFDLRVAISFQILTSILSPGHGGRVLGVWQSYQRESNGKLDEARQIKYNPTLAPPPYCSAKSSEKVLLRMKAFVLFVICVLFCLPVLLSAMPLQTDQTSGQSSNDLVKCVSDDENFTKFYDLCALVLAGILCLLLPSLLPLFPKVANTWLFAGPVKRWIWCGTLGSLLIFLIPVFLMPQLARVSETFRPGGLWVPHTLGNIRLEYLQCDIQTVPKTYGLLFGLMPNPGANLMISYWLQLLLTYAIYATLFTGIYFSVAISNARLRFAALAK